MTKPPDTGTAWSSHPFGAYPLMSGTDLARSGPSPAVSRARLAMSPPDGPTLIVALKVLDVRPDFSMNPAPPSATCSPHRQRHQHRGHRARPGEGYSLDLENSRHDRTLLLLVLVTHDLTGISQHVGSSGREVDPGGVRR